MYRILSTSKSGMNASQTKLDMIGNNIANATTTGYKKVDVGFEDLLSESLNRTGYRTNNDASMGTGVKASEAFRVNNQGDLKVTELGTDLALDGPGYFKVVLSNGTEAYTRDGSFKVDGLGRLVDALGNKVEINYENGLNEENAPLRSGEFTVNTKGEIYSKVGESYTKIGTIPVYTAVGDASFVSAGSNLFVPAEGANITEANGTAIYQGFLESSNVDLTTEFTDLIVTQRAFQLTSKGVTTADEMWQMINNMRA